MKNKHIFQNSSLKNGTILCFLQISWLSGLKADSWILLSDSEFSLL